MEMFSYGITIIGEQFSCTGNQLVQILRYIDNRLTGSWFCDNVEANKNSSKNVLFIEEIIKIGSTEDFILFSSQISQFLSGVFIIRDDDNIENSKMNPMDTEEKQFVKFNNENFQIRAFDTAYFEIYSNEPNLINGLINEFGNLASIISRGNGL